MEAKKEKALEAVTSKALKHTVLRQVTGVIMSKTLSPDQDKLHKNIIRDRYLSSFKQPGRFRAEWERVKQLFRGKGHE